MSGFPPGELDDCLTCLLFQVLQSKTANILHEFQIVDDELLYHSRKEIDPLICTKLFSLDQNDSIR